MSIHYGNYKVHISTILRSCKLVFVLHKFIVDIFLFIFIDRQNKKFNINLHKQVKEIGIPVMALNLIISTIFIK
jgi:hypothetical protein